MTNFGTFRNQYGKLVHDRGPSEGQREWIERLRVEKILTPRAEELLDLYNTDDLSGQHARELLDILFGAKSKIVDPSTLGPQDPTGKPASPKQLNWVNKLVGEKDIPDADVTAIQGYLDEGLTGRHAGRILDYLFDRQDQGAAAPAQGFLGTIGEQITVTGTLTTFRAIESRFGPTNLIVITDDEGHQAKVFSNAKGFWGRNEGDRITVTGTVKSHDEFKGSQSTMLSRPKVSGAPDLATTIKAEVDQQVADLA